MNARTLADALRPYCYRATARGQYVTITTDGGKVRIDARSVTPAHLAILARGPIPNEYCGAWSCPITDFLLATNEVPR